MSWILSGHSPYSNGMKMDMGKEMLETYKCDWNGRQSGRWHVTYHLHLTLHCSLFNLFSLFKYIISCPNLKLEGNDCLIFNFTMTQPLVRLEDVSTICTSHSYSIFYGYCWRIVIAKEPKMFWLINYWSMHKSKKFLSWMKYEYP